MLIQTYKVSEETTPHSGILELQYSSYAEKDIQSSVDLTIQLLSALQRWLYFRPTISKIHTFALQRLTKQLAEHTVCQSNPKSLQRHTVIRSAFVYKKTREQFGLRMRTYRFSFQLTKYQQSIFLTWLCQLKLPAELTVRFY